VNCVRCGRVAERFPNKGLYVLRGGYDLRKYPVPDWYACRPCDIVFRADGLWWSAVTPEGWHFLQVVWDVTSEGGWVKRNS
jgi:hypothetical protein